VSDTIRVEQIKSPIRRHHSQRRTLIGLGLNKIGRIKEVRFNAPSWGMIQKVRHLIRFPDQELFEQHRLVLPQPEDEEADKGVMRQLLFKAEGVELVALPEKTTKTPDYKVMKNGELKGYCELKAVADAREADEFGIRFGVVTGEGCGGRAHGVISKAGWVARGHSTAALSATGDRFRHWPRSLW
jgi:ribosomal protein L30